MKLIMKFYLRLQSDISLNFKNYFFLSYQSKLFWMLFNNYLYIHFIILNWFKRFCPLETEIA